MRNLAKVSPKLTKTDIFGLFWFSSKLSIRFERIVYNLSTPCSGAMCAMTSQLFDWDVGASQLRDQKLKVERD